MSTLRRTNVYLSEEQLRTLKHLAADSDRSVADHVRAAVDAYLARQMASDDAWGDRLEQLLVRVRSRMPGDADAAQIEADITAARGEVRRGRRATRRH